MARSRQGPEHRTGKSRPDAHSSPTGPARAQQSGDSQWTIWTAPLICMLGVGVLLRLNYLDQPMRYDESVTYLEFASRSWSRAIGSYTYPNNHVFHTVLVKACVSIFGNDPWVIRLPAFAAGIAMIPATFSVGRRVFGPIAAHLGTAIVASSGALTLYSTNARGYTMVCLATLVLARSLMRLRERPSIRDWGTVAVVLALGTWTIPVMLFPAGGLVLWFVVSALRDDTRGGRSDVWRLALCVGLSAIAVALLYSPILMRDGLAPLARNAFVRPSTWWLFFRDMATSVGQTLIGWSLGMPVAAATVLLSFAVVGLAIEQRASGYRVSMAGSMYVACALMLVATHRAPFTRVWLFLLAPLALVVGHGMSHILSKLPRSEPHAMRWVSVGLATALATGVHVSSSVVRSRDTGTLPDAERIASSLSAVLRAGDRVVAPLPSNAPLAYYFARAGVDTSYLSATPRDSSRVYLIVNTAERFTLRTPLGDPVMRRFQRAQLMTRFPSAEVYRMF